MLVYGRCEPGGIHMLIDAAKYAQNRKGLIYFDRGGAYVNVDPAAQMLLAQFQAAVAGLGTVPRLTCPIRHNQGRQSNNDLLFRIPTKLATILAVVPQINSPPTWNSGK